MEDRRGTYWALEGRPEGKRPLGRPWLRCGNNRKTVLEEVVWGGMDWIDPAQSRGRWRELINAVMNFPVP